MIEYKRLAKERRKKTRTIVIAVLAALIVMLIATWFICTVRKVEVVGNKNYSAKEIEDLVLSSSWDYNTIYLWYQNKHKTIETPPFLDMVEIEILSYNSIRIHAYEKTIVGYVEYLGNYVYFDKDGTVLETSNKIKEGLPVVEGLEFHKMVLYEKLPVKDQKIFKTLVTLTQMLGKNDLVPDCIEFTSDGQINMTFGEVIVHLGEDEYMDNKIARLTGILPQLEGRSGILYMEDVDETTQRISFKKTKSKAQLEAEQRLREEEEAAKNEDEVWDEESDDTWEEYTSDEGDSLDDDSSDEWSDNSTGDSSDESSDEWSDDSTGDSFDEWSDDSTDDSFDEWSDDSTGDSFDESSDEWSDDSSDGSSDDWLESSDGDSADDTSEE